MKFRLAARQAAGELLYRMGNKRPPPHTLSVLMYHAVTRKNLRDPEQQTVSAQTFSEQLEAVRETGVQWVSLEEGLRELQDHKEGPPMATVVFDDGYNGVHDLAMKTLIRHKIRATLFLPTERMGKPSFPGRPAAWGRPMTWPEVKTVVQETGCLLGSHGHTHQVFSRLSSEQIRAELRTSRREIERLQPHCRLFAYPYGAGGTFDDRTRQIIEEEGFTGACTALWGRCTSHTDPLAIPRIRISWCDTPREIQKSLAGSYDWYSFFQRFRL